MDEFAVWAPSAQRVEVEIALDGPPGLGGGRGFAGARRPLERDGEWWRGAGADHGTDYAFRVDGSEPLPDPMSRRQPYGVGGVSRVYEHDRYGWRDADWRGRDLRGAIIYELHIGTFTPEGTFDAAIERLGHLVELGVDLVELLPVAPTPGRRNWGYDCVDLWAVHEPYGGPDGLKRLVDACHGAGLGVILDVVYNHLGPSGNHLARFGPYFADHASFWGQGVNLDGPGSDEVRRYFLGNALSWLRDFHIDGLRLDAVHALRDTRAVHFLEELAVEVDALAVHLGRPLTLIAESDLNDPRLITPREAGGYGLTAQWNDDVHHALHALVTGECHDYYADFGTCEVMAAVLRDAFLHKGTYSTHRGRTHGRPVGDAPGHRFVCCLQNHDQIGNRPQGDRLPLPLLRVGAGLLLTSPFTPMLFMGEEWAAATPWLFFTDHVEPHLAEGEAGRREREFGWPPGEAPDPQDESAFLRSKLDWSEPASGEHRVTLEWYRSLINLRRTYPDLSDPRLDRVRTSFGDDWIVVHRGAIRVAVNLATAPASVPLDRPGGEILLSSGEVRLRGSTAEMPAQSLVIVLTS